jgi:hypothetical protein
VANSGEILGQIQAVNPDVCVGVDKGLGPVADAVRAHLGMKKTAGPAPRKPF